MKLKTICLTITIIAFLTGCKMSNEKILNKTASKLNSLERIEYLTIAHSVENETGFDEIVTALCYLDFTSSDTFIGTKYQFVHDKGEQVFDGKKVFYISNYEERVIYNLEPKIQHIGSSDFLKNSIYTLKKLLPELVNNPNAEFKRQKDTLIKQEKNYMFAISLKDMFITNDARLLPKKGFTENYELYISSKSFLPTQLTNVFPENKGYGKSEFSNYNLAADRPDSIWDYKRLTQRYLVMSTMEYRESMISSATVSIGQKAPDWSLPVLNGDSLTLSNLNGSLVLLEFWFPGCGGCVKAIPDLNEIQRTYSNKGLNILGIEFSKSNNKGLEEYVLKQNIEYPILYIGKEIAKIYGVNGAPTFFLIDKRGKIIYASIGLKKDELIKAIEDNI